MTGRAGLLTALAVAGAVAAGAGAHAQQQTGEHRFVLPDQVQWQPAPAGLPPGSQMAVLRGDPTGKSGDFVARLKVPPGYHVPLHSHSKGENLTVLSGSLLYGQGDSSDRSKATVLPAGAYIYLPANTVHTVWSGDQGLVLEIQAQAPFEITYLNPRDDPRKQQATVPGSPAPKGRSD
jgi:quercetin dioxygenase-like cupin family protein